MSGCEHERYRFINQPETSEEGIYPVQDKEDPSKLYLMKVYDLHEDELHFTEKAAQLGIGARVITAGKCKSLPKTSFIVMDEIVGDDGKARSLADVRCSPNQLEIALEKYKFLMDNGIYQRDLKGANVMVGLRGEPIIIDYGIARSELNEGPDSNQETEMEIELKKKQHMIRMASLLVDSMTFGKYENKYFKNLDSDNQNRYFEELLVMTTNILRNLYTDNTIKLNISTPYHLKKKLSEYNNGPALRRNEQTLLMAPVKINRFKKVLGNLRQFDNSKSADRSLSPSNERSYNPVSSRNHSRSPTGYDSPTGYNSPIGYDSPTGYNSPS